MVWLLDTGTREKAGSPGPASMFAIERIKDEKDQGMGQNGSDAASESAHTDPSRRYS
jgi:hypothetical protein